MLQNDKQTTLQAHDELKNLLKELLSFDLKREPGQSNDDFIEKLKTRAMPLVKDLCGSELNEFNGEVTDKMKSILSKEMTDRINNDSGISITFSEDLPNYNQIKEALLEVISELQTDKVSN